MAAPVAELPAQVTSQLDVGDCWEWRGSTRTDGRGQVKVGGRGGSNWLPHRYVWTLLVGELEVDLHHRCHNRLCCNPDHLQPLAAELHPDHMAVRRRSQTTCQRGHNDWLTYRRTDGTIARYCRPCAYARRKAQP